jgi:hypothetical protein
MAKGALNKWVLVFVLLVTLLFRLLAWGVAEDEIVHAGHRNQTIPTLTPSGVPTLEPTEGPTAPPLTRPPGEPSDTAVPVPTATPSPVPTSQPTGTAAPATATDAGTATEAPEATATPSAGSETPLPTELATFTAMPTLTGSPTLTLGAPSSSPTAEALPDEPAESTQEATPLVLPSGRTPSPVVSSTALVGSGLLNTSCLWLGAGLLLIIAGIVVLLRWRRSA